jgi:uncharacterized phage-associated protein
LCSADAWKQSPAHNIYSEYRERERESEKERERVREREEGGRERE